MSAVTDREQQVLAHLDRDAMTQDLLDLTAVPSLGGSDAESEVQHLLAERLRRLDLDVDLWPVDLEATLADPDFPGQEVERNEAWGLVGVSAGSIDTTPTDGVALALQGHVDVVPAGDLGQWRGDPFSPYVDSGRIHGRGTCDMKAGVVANLAAVAALRSAGVRLERPFALHLAIGEEDGGLGAFATLARGHRADACVITEPTGGTITIAAAGALTFTLLVPGLATHASTAYVGVSALDVYLSLHRALAELEARRNRDVHPLMAGYPVAYPLRVGRVRCGDWASSVPDLLVAEGRMGVALGEDPQDARADLESAVDHAAAADPWLREHPPTVTWSGGQFASGMYDDAGSGLFDLVAAAHTDAHGGPRPVERAGPYGSDLRLYQGVGVPTLHYGPGDFRLAHSPHESVEVEEMVTVAETLVLALMRSCG